jgi:hypothetical protein
VFGVEAEDVVLELPAVSSATVAVPRPPMQITAAVATTIAIHGLLRRGAGSGVSGVSGWYSPEGVMLMCCSRSCGCWR